MSHVGASVSRVTGPPASRSVSSPVWKALIALTCCRYGNGFLGARGNSLRATSSTVSTMAFLQLNSVESTIRAAAVQDHRSERVFAHGGGRRNTRIR